MMNIPAHAARTACAAAALLLVAAGCGEAPKTSAPPAAEPARAPVPAPSPEPDATPGPAAAQSPAADKGDGAYPGFRVSAFQAKIRRPREGGVAEETFDSRATKTPTLYIINSAGCPACTEYADRMKAVESTYMKKGVDVVHLYPNRGETDEAKFDWHKDHGFAGGQIVEGATAIAQKLEAEVTPTVYVADATGRIVYRGGIDDSMYPTRDMKPWLANALDALLAGREIAEDTTEAEG